MIRKQTWKICIIQKYQTSAFFSQVFSITESNSNSNIPHGRGRAWAFRVPGNSNRWRPPMSQIVIIRSTSDYRSLYKLIHRLVDRAYHRELTMCWQRY